MEAAAVVEEEAVDSAAGQEARTRRDRAQDRHMVASAEEAPVAVMAMALLLLDAVVAWTALAVGANRAAVRGDF